MKAIYLALAILLVLAGLFTGYLLWFPTCQVPQQFKYDVLKDILTIVLAIIAIAIAVVGYLVYRIVSLTLERETEKRISNESKRWIIWLASLTGNKFMEIGNIGQAIKLSEEAYEYARELDEKDPKNQLLLGEIRNNLAYYYAKNNQQEKSDKARGFAEYIHRISHRFPEQRESWEDTYRKVKEVFPEQN